MISLICPVLYRDVLSPLAVVKGLIAYCPLYRSVIIPHTPAAIPQLRSKLILMMIVCHGNPLKFFPAPFLMSRSPVFTGSIIIVTKFQFLRPVSIIIIIDLHLPQTAGAFKTCFLFLPPDSSLQISHIFGRNRPLAVFRFPSVWTDLLRLGRTCCNLCL